MMRRTPPDPAAAISSHMRDLVLCTPHTGVGPSGTPASRSWVLPSLSVLCALLVLVLRRGRSAALFASSTLLKLYGSKATDAARRKSRCLATEAQLQ
eukprot:4415508-Prymnesium_polylepis.2